VNETCLLLCAVVVIAGPESLFVTTAS